MSDYYEISAQLVPLYQKPELDSIENWPMYSYNRPSDILWNAIAANLHKRGWNEKRIKEWLQSKAPRWALDCEMGEALAAVGGKYAAEHISDDWRAK